MAADKYIALSGGILTNTSAVQAGGAGNAGKIVALNDTTGLLDASMIPGTNAFADFTVGTTTVANGDLVYIAPATGLVELAKADADATKSQGFVLVGNTTGNTVTVYFEGENTAVSGQTPGTEYYLSAATAGKVTATPPSNPNFIQPVGFSVTATRMHYHRMLTVQA
jgi:hypothetical protein